MSIGEPRGKKSDDNPRGYSKSHNSCCYYCTACAIVSSLANHRGIAKSASGEIHESSLDIANNFSALLGDKTFENINQLEKALKASCLYTLADGSHLQPVPTTNNIGGYTPPSVVVVLTSAGIPRNIIIEEDDCFKYRSDIRLH